MLPGGGGGDSSVTTLHIYISAIDQTTGNPTFTADKTPKEMFVTTPTWCVITFAAGIRGGNSEVSVGVPPAWAGGGPVFGYRYDKDNNIERYTVDGDISTNEWKFDFKTLG